MTTTNRNLVDTLDDSCFVYASESISELCRMIEEETGQKPTLSDLCDVLSTSIRCCQDGLLQDVNVEAVEMLTAKVKSRKKIVLQPGDVFAVPRSKGGFYFIVYITTNRFGDAFGILQGHGKVARMPSFTAVRCGIPAYTGKELIVNRRWRRITNRKDLLELFPSSPDIYHSKSDNRRNNNVGEFGSAESPDGRLRDLNETEARQVELDTGVYRQILLEEEFEAFLQTKLG